MSSPSAFVTGGTGFIGSHLVERLLARGYSVRCLVRNQNKSGYLRDLPILMFPGDLFSSDILRRAIDGVDYVYHVAGVNGAKKKSEYYRGNRDATRNIVQIAAEANPELKRFVYVSSLTAVGPGKGSIPVDESMPYHPITTYGKSKMEAELEIIKCKARLPVTIVRPPTVYGPRDPATFDFFRTVDRGLVPLAGFRDKYVSIVHSTDLVTGIILAGENSAAVGQTYFIGSEEIYTWREVGRVAKEVMKKMAITVRVPEPVVYAVAAVAGFFSLFKEKASVLNFEKGRDMVQENWTCSIEKAKKELGYRQQVSLAEGIRETVQWYRENGWM